MKDKNTDSQSESIQL